MTAELEALDQIEVHDLWNDIVHRSQQSPDIRLARTQPADRTPIRWRHMAGGLTAAACLVAGLLIVRDRAPEGNRLVPPATAPEVAAEVAALPRLAALALPSTVPDGWHLVELMTAPMIPNAQVGQSAGQLFRRASDGAGIRLLIAPLDDTVTGASAPPQIDDRPRDSLSFESGFASFREAGADIMVEVAGVSTDEAASFVRELSATGSAAELRYATDAPGWLLEHAIDFEPATRNSSPFGVVTYRSDDGRIAEFRLADVDPANEMWRLGVPVDVDGVTIHRTAGTATRQLGPLLVTAAGAAVTDLDEAEVALLTSFALVDDATWQRAADELADSFLALPTIGRLTVGAVDVTLHAGGDDRALCVSSDTVARCVPDRLRWFDDVTSSSFGGDVNLDGTWVHVLAIATEGLKGVDATSDAGPPSTAWMNTASGDMVVVAAVAPAEATTLSIDAQMDANTFWGADGVRPLD